jgi:hypothetical protein
MASGRIRLGITGTQGGMKETQFTQLRILLHAILPIQIHHGDCIGVDEEVHLTTLELKPSGCSIHIHPPLDPKKRAFCATSHGDPHTTVIQYDEKEYLDRNKDIVDNCDILLAFPKSHKEELRSGTWSTVRYADSVKRPVMILV